MTAGTKHEILLLIALFAGVIVTGVLFFYHVEGLPWVDAIYFTSVTLTTVGYGDFVPQTVAGKLFTSVYAFVGIGFFFGLAGIMFHGTLEYSRRKRSSKHRK